MSIQLDLKRLLRWIKGVKRYETDDAAADDDDGDDDEFVDGTNSNRYLRQRCKKILQDNRFSYKDTDEKVRRRRTYCIIYIDSAIINLLISLKICMIAIFEIKIYHESNSQYSLKYG